ncbi:hypothetical protein N7509_006122 [Penicillium cosmopolitanum]|uniref:Uncharacterized protein n=1 Tax=Penicillium cosmopolitanum TaxID=1131564 RepID=A0A9W9W3E7_9EURO|nr:uncharacterized protein N7509_006122 [Penicillium cosmopolitanum]KAJ5398009.1 hypothetical protein N7509_006122 [Penicillium cosmopolitanum]
MLSERRKWHNSQAESKQVISQPFNSSHPLLAPRTELAPKTDDQPSPRKPTQARRRKNHTAAKVSTRSISKRRLSPRSPVLHNFPPKDVREDIRGPVWESQSVDRDFASG